MRIEDYGLIGDLQSAALVGRNGSVDWLCLPRFDSPSCFSALLGNEVHGWWLVAPAGEVRSCSRRYRPGTLILETDFETDDGTVRVVDFMPPRGAGPPRSDADGAFAPPRLRVDRALGRACAGRDPRDRGPGRLPAHDRAAARGRQRRRTSRVRGGG